jgi:hypothetical protein
VLLSLDFLYTPSDDVDAAAARCVEGLGGVLVWRMSAMGTLVAALRLAKEGPLMLFADHLETSSPIAIYRVGSYAGALERLRAGGVDEIRELELPPGPCATFSLAGARLGVYELTRPHAADHLAGRSRE